MANVSRALTAMRLIRANCTLPPADDEDSHSPTLLVIYASLISNGCNRCRFCSLALQTNWHCQSRIQSNSSASVTRKRAVNKWTSRLQNRYRDPVRILHQYRLLVPCSTDSKCLYRNNNGYCVNKYATRGKERLRSWVNVWLLRFAVRTKKCRSHQFFISSREISQTKNCITGGSNSHGKQNPQTTGLCSFQSSANFCLRRFAFFVRIFSCLHFFVLLYFSKCYFSVVELLLRHLTVLLSTLTLCDFFENKLMGRLPRITFWATFNIWKMIIHN